MGLIRIFQKNETKNNLNDQWAILPIGGSADQQVAGVFLFKKNLPVEKTGRCVYLARDLKNLRKLIMWGKGG